MVQMIKQMSVFLVISALIQQVLPFGQMHLWKLASKSPKCLSLELSDGTNRCRRAHSRTNRQISFSNQNTAFCRNFKVRGRTLTKLTMSSNFDEEQYQLQVFHEMSEQLLENSGGQLDSLAFGRKWRVMFPEKDLDIYWSALPAARSSPSQKA